MSRISVRLKDGRTLDKAPLLHKRSIETEVELQELR